MDDGDATDLATEPRAPRRALAVAALLLASLAPGARAQGLEAHARAELFVRVDGDDVKAAVQIRIDAGWHLGHGPTDADVGGPPGTAAPGLPTTIRMVGDGFEWSAPRFPEPEQEDASYGTTKAWLWVHYGAPVIYLHGRRTDASADPAALEAAIRGQTCDPNGCVPYRETVKSQGAGPDALFAGFPADLVAGSGGAADPPPRPVDPAGSVAPEEGGPVSAAGDAPVTQLPLLAFLWTAVAWGLFSLLMPCTYPMIPITISWFTKQAAARRGSVLPLALCYGAGIVLVYIGIGVVIGPAIIPFAAHWVTNLVIGVLFVVFALALFGAMLLQPPQFMLGWAGKATRRGGYIGVFLLGTLLVVTSFTCTAPFVGSLLLAGAAGGDVERIVLGMGTFGLTMAVPFVVLALVPGKVKEMPRSGEWMHTLKVTLGYVELAAALKFFSNVDLVLQWNLLSRELFLLLWFGIFTVCALYLFGVFRLKEDAEPVVLAAGAPVHLHASVGPRRMVAGVAFLLFALYNLHGALGNELDWIMKAMAPPYSTRIGASARSDSEPSDEPVIVKDDQEGALARARAQGKLVLFNFTGFT